MVSPDPAEVWQAYVQARLAVLRGTGAPEDVSATADAVLALRSEDRVALLHEALRDPNVRLTAFPLLKQLSAEDRQRLFSDLVFLASFSYGAIQTVRDAIREMPRDWLMEHIEATAEPLLRRGDYDTYRRLLELYAQIDVELMRRLAERAVVQPDPDTREAGEDFLELYAQRTGEPGAAGDRPESDPAPRDANGREL